MEIQSRSEFPALLTQLGLTGQGVELGVARGRFSAHILGNSPVRRLFSIDRWAGDRGHDLAQCIEATKRLSKFGERSVVLRANFSESVDYFEDGSLDFVYVDGYAHTGNENGTTLELWWPKVRTGGIFAGHDYSDSYLKNKEAVDHFRETIAPGVACHFTQSDNHPTWIMLKE